jgi:hypothetical protein
MAIDGAVAKVKLMPHGHDDVLREFVKKVVVSCSRIFGPALS